MEPPIVWAVTAALALAGAAGDFLPLLPGPPLILAAAVFNKALLPAALSWWTVGGLGFLCLAAEGGQLVLTLGGAKRLGATKWGMFGAAAGALFFVFGGVAWMLAGAAVGALVAEAVVAGRAWDQAAKAALGATLGLAASLVGRVLIAVTMLLWLALDALF